MQSKMKMAKKAAYLGIHVYIANRNREQVLHEFYLKKLKAIYFEPDSIKPNPRK